jgi:hypothetical protein
MMVSSKDYEEYVSLLQEYKGSEKFSRNDIKWMQLPDSGGSFVCKNSPYIEWCHFVCFEEYTADGKFASIADAVVVKEIMAEFANKYNL